jgi:hypothetical protein
MPQYADLEIGLHHREAGAYAVEMRFSLPGSDADNRSDAAQAEFNFDDLRARLSDPESYGQALTESLFADAAALSAFERARDLARSQNPPLGLRVRLLVGPSAPDLHGLHWETLRAPHGTSPLTTSENILFSRYLSSLDWQPVRPRSKSELRALVVVANPPNLKASYGLAEIDVPAELERATGSLGPSVQVTRLPEAEAEGRPARRATLNNLAACLRDESYDILYLVCHGALRKGEPWLWLEDDTGQAEPRTLGQAFLDVLRDLTQRPRLVVLASCQSAGADAGPALLALGPRLAEAGLPAVLAMQGNFTFDTAARLMPKFFEELQRDGQIDRALAVARGAVQGRPDYWMPALFTRLKSGRLWYVPGFGGESKAALKSWDGLINSLKQKKCAPIVGPGLTEPLFGTWRDLAREWAAAHDFPLSRRNQDNLPQVAQYLAASQGPGYPRDTLVEYLKAEVLKRYGPGLPPEARAAELDRLLDAVGVWRRQRDPAEAFSVLARLPFEIYITANLDNLLEDALAAAGKTPEAEIFRWKPDLEWTSVYEREKEYRPTAERPLVYHLFGHLSCRESLVLTEDDCFDYLMRVNRDEAEVPVVVDKAWKQYALLFLGFQMDDWNFRLLLRSILDDERRNAKRLYKSVAAQITPEDDLADPDRARGFLESYFQDAKIDVYWGSAEDFVRELWQRWPQEARKEG